MKQVNDDVTSMLWQELFEFGADSLGAVMQVKTELLINLFSIRLFFIPILSLLILLTKCLQMQCFAHRTLKQPSDMTLPEEEAWYELVSVAAEIWARLFTFSFQCCLSIASRLCWETLSHSCPAVTTSFSLKDQSHSNIKYSTQHSQRHRGLKDV